MQSYRIDYLEFPSRDGAGTRRFLETAFGWAFITYSPDYHGIDKVGIDAGIDSSDSRTAAPLPVIRTADLDAAQRDVEGAGGVVTEPQYDFPGGRRFHFREPGGVEMAVYIEKP